MKNYVPNIGGLPLILLLLTCGVCLFIAYTHKYMLDTIKFNNTGMADERSREGSFKYSQFRDDVTIVTAYFDLGAFQKGGPNNIFTTDLYKKWSKVFSLIMNPTVMYTDSKDIFNMFVQIRRKQTNNTKIFLIDRNSTWAFRRENNISKIYSMPGYPKHHPNTVIPAYTCAQHAKYNLTGTVARENYFRTKYVAWLDIGLFRNLKSTKMFRLEIPEDFNDSKIAMSLVTQRDMATKPEHIFKGNIHWVGGAMFLGRWDVIIKHEEQYKRAVDYYLSLQLSCTDQQTLFAMYSNDGRKAVHPSVELQLYGKGWFDLGYIMRKE